MEGIRKTTRMVLGVSFMTLILFGAGAVCLSGCSKPPSVEEMAKLAEEKSAAESAEKKLNALRQERMRLEQEIQVTREQIRRREIELQKLRKQSALTPAPAPADTAGKPVSR